MELQTSTVHRNLEAKLRILGFEIFDLLAILLFAALMNLIFGSTSLSFPMIFVLPSILAAVIHFGKKGQPDDYLMHVLRYYLLPGAFSSGNRPTNEEKMTNHIYD